MAEKRTDDPILNTRELLYASRDAIGCGHVESGAKIELMEKLQQSIMRDVARLAELVAEAYGLNVRTWGDDMEANEAVFTGDNEEALDNLAELEGAL